MNAETKLLNLHGCRGREESQPPDPGSKNEPRVPSAFVQTVSDQEPAYPGPPVRSNRALLTSLVNPSRVTPSLPPTLEPPRGARISSGGQSNVAGNHRLERVRAVRTRCLILIVASRDLLNPLPPPGRRLEGVPEILCFVDDLAVAELHNTHRVCQSPLVGDRVFRDPEIPVSENPLDLEAGRLAGMMTPQGLQIASPEDSLA